MRKTFGGAAVMILAAASGWFVRGLDGNAEEQLRPAAVIAPASPGEETSPVVPVRVEPYGAVARSTEGGRNLFAYRERAVTPARIAIVPPIMPPVAAVPAPEPAPHVAPPAPFTFRYIGTIGYDHDPIAVFSRDGEIVNVRRGERIDATFVLRTIGIESVEVEDSGGQRRIPLGN